MKIFHYTESANAAGLKHLPAIIICAVLIAWFFYQSFSDKGRPLETKDYLIVAVFVGFLVMAASNVLKRIQSSGHWDISIDNKTVQWNAPDGFEKSFLLNLDEIKELKIVTFLTSNDEAYTLKTRDGRKISLNTDSGIDLESFAKALASQGVKLNEIQEEAN